MYINFLHKTQKCLSENAKMSHTEEYYPEIIINSEILRNIHHTVNSLHQRNGVHFIEFKYLTISVCKIQK